MDEMKQEELDAVVEAHAAWLRGEGGRRANLSGVNLSGVNLSDAKLSRADLSRANLIYADLSRANLSRANLIYANLSRVDLSDADLSDEVPYVPDLEQRMEEVTRPVGHLDMGHWHSECGTAHCRAGWASVIAGERGATLEHLYGPNAAGALIYAKATRGYVPDFFATDKDARADIVARAKGVAK